MSSPIAEERYRKKCTLGSGGTADIQMAVDECTNQHVVLKSIKDAHLGLSRSKVDLLSASLLEEAKIQEDLNHPNILKTLDFIIFEGRITMVMEFVNGQSIKEIVRSRLRYNLGAKINIIGQLCRGIDFSLSRAVLHGDLKPGNVMVNSDWVVKVIDFGVNLIMTECKRIKQAEFWTPNYAAPEQFLGKRSPATDIFATGLIAYELLTGTHPFQGSNARETAQNLRKGLFRESPNVQWLPIESQKWCAVFKRIFSMEPRARYHSADHFFEELVHCFRIQEKNLWKESGRFRSPDTRFETITELESVRGHNWEYFQRQLRAEIENRRFENEQNEETPPLARAKE